MCITCSCYHTNVFLSIKLILKDSHYQASNYIVKKSLHHSLFYNYKVTKISYVHYTTITTTNNNNETFYLMLPFLLPSSPYIKNRLKHSYLKTASLDIALWYLSYHMRSSLIFQCLKLAGLHPHALLGPEIRVHGKLLIVSAIDQRLQIHLFI